MARGFIPAGARSGPQEISAAAAHQTKSKGLLRSPAGINPLATGFALAGYSDSRQPAKSLPNFSNNCSYPCAVAGV
ncbi:hypothetical protein C0J56_00175 [Pseudomonas fluorescens]|nr:hypothetical protein C0J56_00175 [Pseudomonas fluorescens]